MANPQILAPETFLTSTWKNGRGKTTELIACRNTKHEEFNWRLSMAAVVEDGIFSDFSGYDRILILMQGQGLSLHHSNGTYDELNHPYSKAEFNGDYQTKAKLYDGAIEDFNIICKREFCLAKVDILTSNKHNPITINADILLLYAAEGNSHITSPSGNISQLKEQHLFYLQQPDKGPWLIAAKAIIAIQIYLKNI